MSDLTIARRYAQALFEEADAIGKTDAIDADVEMIRESLDGSAELVRFFSNPVISRDKKRSVVEALFGKRLEPTTLNFLLLLIDKGREDVFPSVVAAYQSLRDGQMGIVEATVRTAQSLSKKEAADLETAIAQMTGKKVRLTTEVVPDLIGGLIIRVGDTVYDGSVRNQLANLRDRLEHGTFAVK